MRCLCEWPDHEEDVVSMCIDGVCVVGVCCVREGVLVVLVVFLPFVEGFLCLVLLFGIVG